MIGIIINDIYLKHRTLFRSTKVKEILTDTILSKIAYQLHQLRLRGRGN